MNKRTIHGRQRGVSVITAVFILLLLGVLAALMVNLTSTAHMTSAQDVEGSRAYQAAQAGVEWGLYQLDPDAAVNILPACFAPTSLTQIPGFVVAVTCRRSDYIEAGRSVGIYEITSTAVNGAAGPPAVVERQLAVSTERCRDPAKPAPPFDC